MDVNFLCEVVAALLMGLAIGAERQFGQHPAGLRTNALVCVGAALFVSLSWLMADGSPTRIAAQVVCGIGFLGGGVILREGMTVKGMTTAATLWCIAAVSTLAGSGYAVHAAVRTGIIVGTNLMLIPMSKWIDRLSKEKKNVETDYRVRVVCEQQQGVIREMLIQDVNVYPGMAVRGISIHAGDQPGIKLIVADIDSSVRDDHAMQELMSRINAGYCMGQLGKAAMRRMAKTSSPCISSQACGTSVDSSYRIFDPSPIARAAQINDEPSIDLVEQFSLGQLSHLLDETLDLRPGIMLQILFGKSRRRGIGKSFDSHDVEIARPRFQLRITTGAKQQRAVSKILVVHRVHCTVPAAGRHGWEKGIGDGGG